MFKDRRVEFFPCPVIFPAAAAPALHGIPAGAAVGPAGRTGVLPSGRFAALALALFTGGGCGVQPEQFFRGVRLTYTGVSYIFSKSFL